jgi:16S rRNA (uracil1498-N3)-methyltransferase
MERFFLNQKLAAGLNAEITDPEQVHKISHVLRLKKGAQILVFDAAGMEYLAQVKNADKKSVQILIEQTRETTAEPKIKINLYCGLIKKNRFEIILEKCTEIGVAQFYPIVSERAVVHTESVPQRWKKIIIEAAQQSGRKHIPEIHDPEKLQEILNKFPAGAQIVLASEQGGTKEIAKSIANLKPTENINLFIGPEGGWTSAELEMFDKAGAIKLNLGSRILRAETAAIVFSAFCIYLSNNK